ncbi:MAG: hypothetical protein IBX71_00045 [Candidatus Desulforudis sp.]|nr:hypothetical protein [Desulforudis sp.]
MCFEAAFASINGVPVIGARFLDRDRALSEVNGLTEQVARCVETGSQATVRVGFKRQDDGRFSLEVCGHDGEITVISGVDELMFRRFNKAYDTKKMFILTSFVAEDSGAPVSLVVSDGLGVVIYKPNEALQL